jgi:hypothetical protein
MLADRLRADDLKVGLLIKREFGTGANRSLHYHILFESDSISDLPQLSLEKIKKAWFRIVGAKNNATRYFDWKTPHDGKYLKKSHKHGQSVIAVPRLYKDTKMSLHLFHTRGLGRRAGLGQTETPFSHRAKTRWCDGQLKASVSSLAPTNIIPYCSPLPETETKLTVCDHSQSLDSLGKNKSTEESSPAKFTQNPSPSSDEFFTHSNSKIHTKLSLSSSSILTQNGSEKICETCEYHGIRNVLRHDEEICPACGERWDMCCPF